MRKTRIILFIALAALLGAIVFAFQRHGNPPAISFLGYTNVTTSGRIAMFGFTNQTRVTIRRWCGVNPEFKTRAGQPWLFTINVGADAVLGPGESEVVLVPMDTNMIFTNSAAWHAVFFWREEGAGVRFQNWANTSNIVPPMFQRSGLRVRPLPSEWIEQ